MEFDRPEIIRPPSEHASYFLPLTSGCSNNTCIFCNSYGVKLKLRDIDDVKQEIDAMLAYVQSGIRIPSLPEIVYIILSSWDGRRVFLQDKDALVYPYAGLMEIITYLNEKFPNLERIGSYVTPQDILRRSPDELKAIRGQKLSILYMGVESGDDTVLQHIGKGVDHNQLVEAGRKAKEAGFILSVTVILGLAGKEGSEKHALETAKVLTAMDPDYVGALTLTLVPGTPLCDQFERGDFSLLLPFDSLVELKSMVENSDFTNCFFSSMHASNYISIRGTLPGDKQQMTAQLESILQTKDPRLLRPEFLRGL
ncbi:radical SAM protein [Chloroflexota bacterium]